MIEKRNNKIEKFEKEESINIMDAIIEMKEEE